MNPQSEGRPTCLISRRPRAEERPCCEHAVQFYETDAYLIGALGAFVEAGLRRGDQVIVIVTEEHRRALEARLGTKTSFVAAARAGGSYLALDAGETLAKFMVDGAPDAARFHQIVGGLFAWASARGPSVRAFGEMVALLWAEGNGPAAIQLEELWNDLQKMYTFSLLCAYRMSDFRGTINQPAFAHICQAHSRVLPAESFPTERGGADEPARAIALLQQKAVSLEVELAERHRLEEALRRSKDELTAFVESASLPMHWVGSEGEIMWANQAELEMLGYSREEYFGRPVRDFHVDEAGADQLLARLSRGEEVRAHQAQLRCKDGSVRTVLIDSSPLLDQGRFVRTHCFTRDVTEQRRSEQSSRHLAAIVECSDDAIISKDLDGIITSWNRGAERIFGYTVAEAVGQSIALLIPPERQGEEQKILAKIRQGRRIDPLETVRRSKQGRLLDISLTFSPIRDEEGRIVGISKIARDITARKKIERELEQVREQAVAASRAKDDFLATLSHELRTPLSPVLLLATEAARDAALPADVRADFELIAKNVALEARLIDDLLDLTRITRGKLVLDRRYCDVRHILHDAIAIAHDELAQKQIAFIVRLGDQPCPVLGDRVRLLQVFWNLLKNAVKFTPEQGTVRVELVIAGPDAAVITVADSGIGVTTAEMKRLFSAFSQGDHAGADGSYQFGGLGLGLAISRTLIELHDGSIRASSPGRGRGATFTIELPLARGEEIAPGDVTPVGAATAAEVRRLQHGCRVLLVEDHASTRTALTRLLERRGCQVASAGSVSEARLLAAMETIDLVISDIGLPDGSGHDLMAELRVSHGVEGIALTGYGAEEDIERSRASGFSMHLTKPVQARELDDALTLIAGRWKAPPPPVPSS